MYLSLLILGLIMVLVVSVLFFLVSYKKLLDSETFSTYECGFSLVSHARMFFSFRFFLISILFLIFDVEIALMLPLPYLMMSSSSSMEVLFLFFFVLILGLIYEYYYGSLNWMNFISKA